LSGSIIQITYSPWAVTAIPPTWFAAGSTGSNGWANLLSRLNHWKTGASLLDRIRKRWCEISIDCDEGGLAYYPPVTSEPGIYRNPHGIIRVSHANIQKIPQSDHEQTLSHILVVPLVLACGGTLLDGIVIAEATIPGDPKVDFSDLGDKNSDLVKAILAGDYETTVLDEGNGRVRRLTLGNFIWWDRENGDVGMLSSTEIFLNGDWWFADITKKRWRF
jgi:hypothetical protein